MEIKLKEPLFVLSKKYYAGGEVVIEFIVLNNQKVNVVMTLTFKTKEEADIFELKKEYQVEFTPI